MSNKRYTEVVCMIQDEIDSIKSKNGELPPTAYVVVEVSSRLKSLQHWEGYNPKKSHTVNIRNIVEEILKGKRNIDHAVTQPDLNVIWIAPPEEDTVGLIKREKLKKRLKQAG